MVKESRVLQWFIDSYTSPNDFKNMTEEQKLELIADNIFYSNQIIFTLQNQLETLKKQIKDLPIQISHGTL